MFYMLCLWLITLLITCNNAKYNICYCEYTLFYLAKALRRKYTNGQSQISLKMPAFCVNIPVSTACVARVWMHRNDGAGRRRFPQRKCEYKATWIRIVNRERLTKAGPSLDLSNDTWSKSHCKFLLCACTIRIRHGTSCLYPVRHASKTDSLFWIPYKVCTVTSCSA